MLMISMFHLFFQNWELLRGSPVLLHIEQFHFYRLKMPIVLKRLSYPESNPDKWFRR